MGLLAEIWHNRWARFLLLILAAFEIYLHAVIPAYRATIDARAATLQLQIKSTRGVVTPSAEIRPAEPQAISPQSSPSARCETVPEFMRTVFVMVAWASGVCSLFYWISVLQSQHFGTLTAVAIGIATLLLNLPGALNPADVWSSASFIYQPISTLYSFNGAAVALFALVREIWLVKQP